MVESAKEKARRAAASGAGALEAIAIHSQGLRAWLARRLCDALLDWAPQLLLLAERAHAMDHAKPETLGSEERSAERLRFLSPIESGELFEDFAAAAEDAAFGRGATRGTLRQAPWKRRRSLRMPTRRRAVICACPGGSAASAAACF